MPTKLKWTSVYAIPTGYRKVCEECKVDKVFTEFDLRRSGGPDGDFVSTKCRACKKMRQRAKDLEKRQEQKPWKADE